MIKKLLMFFLILSFFSTMINAEKTVKLGIFSRDIKSLSPLHTMDLDSYSVISSMFESLLYFDSNAKIKTQIAYNYKQIDSLTWQFNIYSNRRFHNGEELDAESVKYSYEKMINPATKSQQGTGFLSTIKRVDVIDKYRFNIVTKFPDPMLLHKIAMYGQILPRKYINKHGLKYFEKNPIGSGPFQFIKWIKDKEIVLKRYDKYFDKNLIKYDKLIFKIIKRSKWFSSLKQGKVDIISNITRKEAIKTFKNGKLYLKKRVTLSSHMVLLNTNKPHLKKINVRRALNYAIDKKELIISSDSGMGMEIPSLGKRFEFGSNENLKPYKFNINLAKKLLKDSGYKNGLKLECLVSKSSITIAKNLKKQLKRVKIDLKLHEVSNFKWNYIMKMPKLTGKSFKEYDIAINVHTNSLVNFGFQIYDYLFSKGSFSMINDYKLDTYLIKTLTLNSFNEHRSRLEELDRYIHESALMLFTYQRNITYALNRKVKMSMINLNGLFSNDMIFSITKE